MNKNEALDMFANFLEVAKDKVADASATVQYVTDELAAGVYDVLDKTIDKIDVYLTTEAAAKAAEANGPTFTDAAKEWLADNNISPWDEPDEPVEKDNPYSSVWDNAKNISRADKVAYIANVDDKWSDDVFVASKSDIEVHAAYVGAKVAEGIISNLPGGAAWVAKKHGK